MAHIGIAVMGSRPGQSGGVDIYTHDLRALARYGRKHQYSVMLQQRPGGGWNDEGWPDNVTLVRLLHEEPRQPFAVRLKRRMRRYARLPNPAAWGEAYWVQQIDRAGFDLLHFPRTVIWPTTVQTPCVLTFFDLQQEYYPEFFTAAELSWRNEVYSASVTKAQHVIVPTEFTANTLIEKYETPKAKMTVIPPGLAHGFVSAASADAIAWTRTKYRLPEQHILYPANPWPHKNHARLMAALRLYRREHGDCPWLVLTGTLENEPRDAMAYALAAGIEDRVIDLRFVDGADLPALYSGTALMVFPSLFEGFGIPLVEAMACGCPIAAADATTIPEVAGGAALLFDPFEPAAIAAAIHRLLHDAPLRESLVERGSAQVERFDWVCLVARLEEVYDRVLKPAEYDAAERGGHA